MITKDEQTLNTLCKTKEAQNEPVSTSSEQSVKKFDKGMSVVPQLSMNTKMDRDLILEKIKELAPVNITALSRALPYSRSSTYYMIIALETEGKVRTEIVLKDKHVERMIYPINKQGESNE